MCVPIFLDAKNGEARLGLADAEHALGGPEAFQPLPGDLIFSLPFGEGDDLNPLAVGEGVDGPHEGITQRPHQRGRGRYLPTPVT